MSQESYRYAADGCVIVILPCSDGRAPAGKLADVELSFTDGLLKGSVLHGFAVWESRGNGRNMTVPARSYTVNGERRSFALLRPGSDLQALASVKVEVLRAYADFLQSTEPAPVDLPAGHPSVTGMSGAPMPPVAAVAFDVARTGSLAVGMVAGTHGQRAEVAYTGTATYRPL